jgi:acyl-CoA thioesterase-1
LGTSAGEPATSVWVEMGPGRIGGIDAASGLGEMPSRRPGPVGRYRITRAPVAASALAVVLVAGCGSDPAAVGASDLVPSAGAVAGKAHRIAGKAATVVALGDSVPAGGGGCDCPDFVATYAKAVEANTGKPSTVENLANGGSTSGDVLDELDQPEVKSAIRSATIVLIMTGANDYDDAFDQASIGIDPTDVYPPVATVVQDNIVAAVTRIKALNKKAHVVVLDYWAAEEDGAVARRQYDVITEEAAAAATVSVNAALAVAAKAAGATYLSTYTAFKGADGRKDPTGLLGADGDHPNSVGNALIAATLSAVFPDG